MNVSGIQRYNHLQPYPVSQETFEKMQHDLRTPLCVILGVSEIISAEARTAQQKNMAEILKLNSEILTKNIALLGDLLRKSQA